MSKYLKDVHEKHYFVLGNKHIKNLQELLDNLRDLSEDSFKHYVNEHHNHFMNWIRDVIKDEELAGKLKDIYDKNRTIETISLRIDELSTKKMPEIKIIKTKPKEPEKISESHEKKHIPTRPVEVNRPAPRRIRASPYLHFQIKEFLGAFILGFVIGVLVSKMVWMA